MYCLLQKKPKKQKINKSFKGQFVAEALQVSVSIVPIMICQVIRRPYIPCQDLPESFFEDAKKEKKKPKKTWKQRIFSLETLCIISLATTVFMAGFLDNDDQHKRFRDNDFGNNRNRNRNTHNAQNGFQQRKYGAYY